MTNLEYAIFIGDLAIITRAVEKYIYSRISHDAPLWKKERLYNEWCALEHDDNVW